MVKKIPQEPPEWYTAVTAARVSGLSSSMINYLCRQKVVEPSFSRKRGHGTARHYSFGDLIALRLIARLSVSGVQPLRLRKAIQRLRKMHPAITLESLPASHLVTDGVEIYLRQDGEWLENLRDGQLAFGFVVDLSQLHAEVARHLPHRKTA